jgi:stearoyl-CoA desaturase (delta-9 desaturase)
LCPTPAGDLSTNCWWVAAVSFGEGWHNSHHAFPYSARHGLEWWELDPTWYLICILKAVGLVWDVQVCMIVWFMILATKSTPRPQA